MDKTIEKVLFEFRSVVHAYVSSAEWGNSKIADEYYKEQNKLCDTAKEEIKTLRDRIEQLQADLTTMSKHAAFLADQLKTTTELHQAILDLEGSEGMTDANFAKWVIAALSQSEEKDDG